MGVFVNGRFQYNPPDFIIVIYMVTYSNHFKVAHYINDIEKRRSVACYCSRKLIAR